MAEISVIVPVYKVEKYLDRCVQSLLRQTFRDFDLVLVDDGSPDSCGQMCQDWAKTDSRIQVIHRENGGLSAARNTGIDWAMAHSDSQWLAFVDSDDWVDPTYLQQLYQAVRDTGCLLSVCGLYRSAGEILPEEAPYQVEKMTADAYYCSPTIHGGVTATAWNKLYHKSLFATIRYPEGRLHEDEFTTYRLVFQAREVAVVPGALYGYFQNQAGIMGSPWKPQRMDALDAMEQQMAFAREQGLPNLEKRALRAYLYAIDSQMEQVKQGQWKKFKPVLRKRLRWGLKQGKATGAFPLSWENRWLYEEAYPCKVLWWLVSKLGGRR